MLAGHSAWTPIDCSQYGVPLLREKGESIDVSSRFDGISLTIPRRRVGTVGTIVVTTYRLIFLIPESSQAYTCKRSVIAQSEMIPYPGGVPYSVLFFELSLQGEHFTLQGPANQIIELHLSLANIAMLGVTVMPTPAQVRKVIGRAGPAAAPAVHGLAAADSWMRREIGRLRTR